MALFERAKAESPARERARKQAEELRKKLKTEPDDVPTHLALADALCAAGEKREAVQHLSKAGAALHRKERVLEAIALYKKTQQIDPKGEVTAGFLVSLNLKQAEEVARGKAAASAPKPAVPVARPDGPGPDAAGAARPAAPVSPDGPHSEHRQRVKRAIESVPLLKDVPPFLLELIVDKILLRSLQPGETLFEEGQPGDSVIFLAAGELSVSVRSGPESGGPEPRDLSTLHVGDVAGEVSFLSGLPRTATLTATSPTVVLELTRRTLDPILRRHRRLLEALNGLYRERVLDQVLARSPLFSGLPRAERDRVAPLFMPILAKAGEPVVRQGETETSVYVIRKGEVRVSTRRGGRDVALAVLGPSEFFGDLAATRATPRTATVTAVTDVEMLCLPRTHLLELLSRNPEMREALEAIQLDRFVKTSQILSRP